MTLLDLPGGRVSLEFGDSERDRVSAWLPDLDARRTRHATHDVVTVRGQTLVYVDEWDEPCLISMSVAGDALLREIGGDGISDARSA